MDNTLLGLSAQYRQWAPGNDRGQKVMDAVTATTGLINSIRGSIDSAKVGKIQAPTGNRPPLDTSSVDSGFRDSGLQVGMNTNGNTSGMDYGSFANGFKAPMNDFKAPNYSALGGELHALGGRLFDFGGFAQGMQGMGGGSFGQFGSMVNSQATTIGNIGGNVNSRSGNNGFQNNNLNIAYGVSNENKLFSDSRRTQNERVNDYTRDLVTKDLFRTSAANTSSGLQSDLSKVQFGDKTSDIGLGKKIFGVNQASNIGMGWGAEAGGKIGDTFRNPKAGAIATVAGAGIGGTVGGIRAITGYIRGRRNLDKINEAVDYRNRYNSRSMQDSVSNYGTRNHNLMTANFSSFGGELNDMAQRNETEQREGMAVTDASTRSMNPSKLLYRLGGNLFANGGFMGEKKSKDKVSYSDEHYKTGITEFNEGGSHEENPRGGIPQGADENGTPNLVEEGEVKISSITGSDNQYILSNRLTIDAEIAGKYGIDKKYVGKTFAAAFRDAYKPVKEHPNDPVWLNELATLCNNFQAGQEALKDRLGMNEGKQQEQMQEQMQQPMEGQQMPSEGAGAGMQAEGQISPSQQSMQALEQVALGQQPQQQTPNVPDNVSGTVGNNGMACGGNMKNKFANGGSMNIFADGGDYTQPIGYNSYLDELYNKIQMNRDRREFAVPESQQMPFNGTSYNDFGYQQGINEERRKIYELYRSGEIDYANYKRLNEELNAAIEEENEKQAEWENANKNQYIEETPEEIIRKVSEVYPEDAAAMQQALETENPESTPTSEEWQKPIGEMQEPVLETIPAPSPTPETAPVQTPAPTPAATPAQSGDKTTTAYTPTTSSYTSGDQSTYSYEDRTRARQGLMMELSTTRNNLVMDYFTNKWKSDVEAKGGKLVMNGDGNFVEYPASGGTPVIHTKEQAAALAMNDPAWNFDKRMQLKNAVERYDKQYQTQKADDIGTSMGERGQMLASKMRYAPLFSSVQDMFSKRNVFDADKYNFFDYKALQGIHDAALQDLSTYNPKFIDPRAYMAPIEAQGAANSANAARVSGGNAGLAAAAAASAGMGMYANLSEMLQKGLQYNEALRQQAAEFESKRQQYNAQQQNALNMENDKLMTDIYRNIGVTTGSVDQANKESFNAALNRFNKNAYTVGKEADNRWEQINLLKQDPKYGVDKYTGYRATQQAPKKRTTDDDEDEYDFYTPRINR